MAMSNIELYQELKKLSEQEADVYNSLIAQEDYKRIIHKDIPESVRILKLLDLADIQIKKMELFSLIDEKAQCSAKQPDQNDNTISFILSPDWR